jgi:hypothetical protein
MVLELRGDVVGSNYLRAKGQRHRRGAFVDNIRKSIS